MPMLRLSGGGGPAAAAMTPSTPRPPAAAKAKPAAAAKDAAAAKPAAAAKKAAAKKAAAKNATAKKAAAKKAAAKKPAAKKAAAKKAAASAASRRCGVAAKAATKKAAAAGEAAKPIDWQVPSGLQAALERWGPALLSKVASARAAWFQGLLGPFIPPSGTLHIGTDCSGAQAPIWALKGMGISHVHVFACDVSAASRSFINATSPPAGPIFDDMLARRPEEVPIHNVYVCGFPCTPFSTLRQHKTKLLKEVAAKPFFAAVETIGSNMPALAILENVMGVQRVMDRVVLKLRKLLWYHVVVVPIDSAELGEPVRRPRFFFILVRKDLSIVRDNHLIKDFVISMLKAARARPADTISDRILPNSHPRVCAFVAQEEKTAASPAQTKADEGGMRKWIAQHEKFAAENRLSRRSPSRVGVAGLRCPRVLDGWDLLVRAHPGENLVADLSQGLPRASFSAEGICPTITPNGIYVLKRLGRTMMPEEKLLAHGFPLHKMTVPKSLQKNLGVLGGNTMHLASIGLALLIGIGLVGWTREGAKPGKKPEATSLLRPLLTPAIYTAESEAPAPTNRVRKRPARMALKLPGVAVSASSPKRHCVAESASST